MSATLGIALTAAALHGTFEVEQGFFPVTSAATRDLVRVHIWYPQDRTMQYPLAVFVHGKGAGGGELLKRYSDFLSEFASAGFVVVAPESCPTAYCADLHKDVLQLIELVRWRPQVHLAFPLVEMYQGVTVVGHSMGALAALRAASFAGHNITSAVAIHPALHRLTTAVPVPLLYLTGTRDSGTGKASSGGLAALGAYANVVGAGHNDLTNGEPQLMNKFAALFALCHSATERAWQACDQFHDTFCVPSNDVQAEECRSEPAGKRAD
ncbi:hypothetical protein DIPPA_28574 [Diplonema papillatum]|nr:hypothetical protein DIPPA_28574 [Diplonema papillatum]